MACDSEQQIQTEKVDKNKIVRVRLCLVMHSKIQVYISSWNEYAGINLQVGIIQ
jgi:hypothetical protein